MFQNSHELNTHKWILELIFECNLGTTYNPRFLAPFFRFHRRGPYDTDDYRKYTCHPHNMTTSVWFDSLCVNGSQRQHSRRSYILSVFNRNLAISSINKMFFRFNECCYSWTWTLSFLRSIDINWALQSTPQIRIKNNEIFLFVVTYNFGYVESSLRLISYIVI